MSQSSSGLNEVRSRVFLIDSSVQLAPLTKCPACLTDMSEGFPDSELLDNSGISQTDGLGLSDQHLHVTSQDQKHCPAKITETVQVACT